MGRNLHWSIIAASEDQQPCGATAFLRKPEVNTSELVAKIAEAHSVSKTQAQGNCGQHTQEPARGRNGGRPFKMTAAK
jgi:hypothetical protein